MTAFVKDQFHWDGMYLTYGPDRRFVARFKHRTSDRHTWITFMLKHFTVEEWFAAREWQVTPLKLMESRGYLLPHIRKWLRDGTIKEFAGKTAAEWRV